MTSQPRRSALLALALLSTVIALGACSDSAFQHAATSEAAVGVTEPTILAATTAATAQPTTSTTLAATTTTAQSTSTTVVEPSTTASSTPAQTVVWSYTQEPSIVGAPFCGPPTSCVIPFSLLGASTGTMAGTTTQTGSAVQLSDGSLYANSTLVFTGTIEACGTGTIAMRSTGYNRNGVTSGEIEIIDGSGTDGLIHLAGHGTVIDGHADPSGNGGSSGQIDLDVTC